MSTQSHLAFNNTGFRLQYLEVLNWGTFDKVCWQIEPGGHNALLTGDIGSGKSTLVDALTCLLVPHHKIVFNKAAGAESKERNILSYVKGEYKKEKEEITKAAKRIYLRPDNNTYSVIIGNFKNEGYLEHVCLAQVFWPGKDGKIEKMLLISPVPLHVAEHFSNFADIGELRKKLKQVSGLQFFNDNFSQYSDAFRRLLGMNSDKAIDLFYQTVSMKAVSSLTTFVREQMLERTDVKEQIGALLKRFDDLNKSHAAVVNAREQYEILKPLAEGVAEYESITRSIADAEAMVDIMPAWFAAKKKKLLEEEIFKTKQQLSEAEQQQEILNKEKDALESKKLGILQDIDNNGGKRLEQIAGEIKQQEEQKHIKKKDYDDYDKLAKTCNLESALTIEAFKRNTEKARKREEEGKQKELKYREQRDNIVTEMRKQQNELSHEEEELRSLKERKTQIPGWLVGFRTQLCNDLRIPEDDLPFAGELLKVHEDEATWQGAVEKLLRDTGISLLVPPNHFRSVSNYINNNTLKSPDGRGIKVTSLEASTSQVTKHIKQLDDQSIFYKLSIKPDTPFYDWLEQYLQRSFGDYLCVNDVNELQQISFGITQQGLIKSGRIRYTKDDRKSISDRKNYVLGWSNVEKIKALEEAVQQLEETIHYLQKEKKDIEEKQEQLKKDAQILTLLLSITDYTRINWQYHVVKIHALEKELKELLENNDKLALLNRKKDEVEELLKELENNKTKVTETVGSLKKDIAIYNQQHQHSAEILANTDAVAFEKWFPIIDSKLDTYTPKLKNIDNKQEEFRKQIQGSNGEISRLKTDQTNLRSSIEKSMGLIKNHSKAEYDEVAANIDARDEYVKRYETLVTEDLKRHEDRFKEDLNKHTINSISVFDNQLERHEKEIKEKIKIINQHLNEIVYNAAQDTYITILMDQTPNPEVRLFREELKKCYTHSFSSNNELYTEEKYEQVRKILDRFSSSESADKEWTSTVTDVRQWFEFNASERYRADDAEKEFYEGSGGKSGGQKEKLAYTILASALAYQFGLQFGESKSRSFRFVVIDEAFGRGSDESTRYGLELFKKLDLQLLIVTPLQKIHVIESHVNSFHFVINRDGNNSQVSNFTKKQYEAEKLLHNNRFKDKEAGE
ncbi:MAG: AAA family ATPase [Bacteroidetes bacterium]|nr:AAA family ATPase [Bacteroidota bacterium]